MTQDKDAESSRPRVVSWFLRPQAPPLWLGIVVAAGLIALETLLVLALERFTDENAYGALLLLGVLVTRRIGDSAWRWRPRLSVRRFTRTSTWGRTASIP